MKKKILHVAKYHNAQFGGIEHISRLINKEFNNEYKITTLAFMSPGVKKNKERNVISCKPLFTMLSQPICLKYFVEFIRQSKKNDIIYIHYPNILAIFSLLFVDNKKIIIHWHSDVVNKSISYLLVKWVEKKALIKSTSIIVSTRNYLKNSYALKNYHKKINVINYGINDDSKKNYIVSKLFKEKINTLKLRKKLILGIGRLVDYKGFKYLIHSMEHLNQNHFSLIIVGNGKLKSSLEKLIKKNQLRNVLILENITQQEKYYLYKNSDIFCLPSISRAEAYGLVLVEALSFGIPLVTFKMPESGTNYINVNNSTGYFAKHKDAKDLARKIRKITNNKSDYDALSKNSRKRYLENFKQERFVSNMSKLFSKYE